MRHTWYITHMYRIFGPFMINTGKWHTLRSSTYAYVAISLKKCNICKRINNIYWWEWEWYPPRQKCHRCQHESNTSQTSVVRAYLFAELPFTGQWNTKPMPPAAPVPHCQVSQASWDETMVKCLCACCICKSECLNVWAWMCVNALF